MIIFLIFLSFYLGNAFTYSLLAFLIVAIVFLFFVFKRFKLFYFLISLGTLLLGISYSFLNLSYPKSIYNGVVYTVKENYFLFNSGGERLYVYSKGHSYDIGDYLSIKGEKQEISSDILESGFDFKDYLKRKGVYKELSAKTINVKWRNFVRLNTIKNKFLSSFNKEERSIVGAILFSINEDSETKDTLTNLHLTRFLSSSGIYIALFAMILNYILSLFLKGKYSELITLTLLIIYMVCSFPKFSVMRIVLIMSLKWINQYLLKKRFSYLEIISIGGLFFLLLDHHLALQESFFLGFFIPIIFYLIRSIFPSSKIKSYLMKTVAIYLFFIPFEIMFYNEIVILSLPLQIISTPLFLIIGLLSLLCFFKIPLIAIDKFFIFLLNGYSKVISPLSFGVLLPDFLDIVLVLYYFIYIIFLYYLGIGYHPIRRIVSFILLSFVLFQAMPIDNMMTEEVNFINVGQGDCTLIRHHQKVILVDTGGLTYHDIANDNLIPYLRKKRIYRIDSVFITHYDYDHFGALENLIKEYHPSHIYDYNSTFPITIGGLTFNNYNTYGQTSNEENDRSLVISFNMCNKDFLIMGDAPMWVEKKIIKDHPSLSCDILKVGHHGSDTSTCEEWLNHLHPKEAIISCGKNNRFGHPSSSVVSLLNKHHITIRRTDKEGTIVYKKFSFY